MNIGDKMFFKGEEITITTEAYNLYGGDLSNLTQPDYGMSCLEAGLQANATQITEDPAPAAGWFLLVSGANPLGEGSLGQASDRAPRPNPAPCSP